MGSKWSQVSWVGRDLLEPNLGRCWGHKRGLGYRAGDAGAGCEGIPALLGLQHLGSCAGSQGVCEGDNPILSCPRDGVFLREEQRKGVQGTGWEGPCQHEGSSMRRCKSSKPAWRKNYFLFFLLLQNLFLSIFCFLLKCQNLQIWQVRKPNPITKILKRFEANYFTSSLLREIKKKPFQI